MICSQPLLVGVDGGSCGGIRGRLHPGGNILFSTWICTSNIWRGRWVHWENSRPERVGLSKNGQHYLRNRQGRRNMGRHADPRQSYSPLPPTPPPTAHLEGQGATREQQLLAGMTRGLYLLVQFLPTPPWDDPFRPGPFLPGARLLTPPRPALHSGPPSIFRSWQGLLRGPCLVLEPLAPLRPSAMASLAWSFGRKQKQWARSCKVFLCSPHPPGAPAPCSPVTAKSLESGLQLPPHLPVSPQPPQ